MELGVGLLEEEYDGSRDEATEAAEDGSYGSVETLIDLLLGTGLRTISPFLFI